MSTKKYYKQLFILMAIMLCLFFCTPFLINKNTVDATDISYEITASKNDSYFCLRDYDLIITGDLGIYGLQIFKELLLKEHDIRINNCLDAGAILYKKDQIPYAGSSGPVTIPLVLFNKILKEKKYKKVLVLATGSLHCPTLVNQHNSIPAICHAISLEVNHDIH